MLFNLNDMKLTTRLTLGFGSVLILMSSALLVSIFKICDLIPLLILTGVVIVLSLSISYFITRSLVSPLKCGIGIVGVLAEGNLNKDIQVSGQNEIGCLLSGMQSLVVRLRQVITSVKIAADDLAIGSRQLTNTSDNLSDGARDLSVHIDQSVTAMTEMSQTIIDVANNASQAADASKKASEAAIQGKNMVEKSVDDMIRIADSIKQTAITIEELGKSSATIGEIVTVINDIADQTNLLALNAAIEAARAGEQGRGFAVVADEVRKLAERTSQATKDIAQRINNIQNVAGESVNAIKRGSKEVENGVEFARRASASLDSIVQVSAEAMDMVQLIASSTEEQSAASEEVTRNMEDISRIAKKSAEAAQYIGGAASDLFGLTAGLKENIAFFKGTPEEAEALVKKAISYIRANGKEKSFAEINNPKGDFVNRDLYVFVHDMTGTVLAHGRDIGKIGKCEINFKDANNVSCVKDRIAIATTKGKGWQQYQNINPVTKKIEDKIAYIEKYEDFMVGSGAYK